MTIVVRSHKVWGPQGTEPNLNQIGTFVERSLMLVTARSPVIG